VATAKEIGPPGCLEDPIYAIDAKHPLTRKIFEAIEEGILVLFAAANGGQTCPLGGLRAKAFVNHVAWNHNSNVADSSLSSAA
jgi:hypothetical protein